jgi:hypothetical protein
MSWNNRAGLFIALKRQNACHDNEMKQPMRILPAACAASPESPAAPAQKPGLRRQPAAVSLLYQAPCTNNGINRRRKPHLGAVT